MTLQHKYGSKILTRKGIISYALTLHELTMIELSVKKYIVTIMEAILRLLKKEEPLRYVVSQKFVFRNDFKKYYIKDMSDGTKEFWAYATGERHDECDKWYLGRYENGFIIRAEGFEKLPYYVEKSAEQLFDMLQKNVK